jgi:hypothetical protein
MYCTWEKHEISTQYSLCHDSKHWILFIWYFVKYMVIYYDIWKCASRGFTCRNCNCFLYLMNKNRFCVWMFVLADDVVTHCISVTAWINRQPPCICVSSRTLVSNVWRIVVCTFVRDFWMCEQKTPTPRKHGNITRWIFNGRYSDYKHNVSVYSPRVAVEWLNMFIFRRSRIQIPSQRQPVKTVFCFPLPPQLGHGRSFP